MNTAIVGCGNIAPIHADSIQQSKFSNLNAVCDIIKERADNFSKQYICKSYYNFDELLADKSINCIHICTPHYLHAEMAIKSAMAGKHIVLEKPIALNSNEAKTVIDAVNSKGVSCCTILQNRLNPCIKTAIQKINSGELGKMLGIKAFLTWKRTKEYYQSEEWRGKLKTEGGGLLINQAIHLLDLIKLLGGEIEAVKANVDTRVLTDIIEVEDTAEATIYYKDGKFGHFFATNCYSTDSPFFLEMHFEKGTLRYMDGLLTCISDNSSTLLANDKSNSIGKNYWGCGHSELINNFYESIEIGKKNYTDLNDSYPIIKLLDAIYLSSKTNNKIYLE